MQFKVPTGNSGLQYRSFILPGKNGNNWRVGGYQADFSADNAFTGANYGEQYRLMLAEPGERSTVTHSKKVKKWGFFSNVSTSTIRYFVMAPKSAKNPRGNARGEKGQKNTFF